MKQKTLLVLCSVSLISSLSFGQLFVDRFDGSTSSNWQRSIISNIGSASWAIGNGVMTFSTPGIAIENQVFVSNSTISLDNSNNWSVEIGMCNTTAMQLQAYVFSNDGSEWFGVTLGGYFGVSNQKWGAEFPGNEWWRSGIRNDAAQQGAIKIEYNSTSRKYSLFYSNEGLDPISNNYNWTLSNYRLATEQAEMQLYLGMNTDNVAVIDGQLFFDNLRVIPEPSALSILAIGLGGLAMMRRRRS